MQDQPAALGIQVAVGPVARAEDLAEATLPLRRHESR
jgi:hypothetical protein